MSVDDLIKQIDSDANFYHRLDGMLGMEGKRSKDQLKSDVVNLIGSYKLPSISGDQDIQYYYILDEVGSRLLPCDGYFKAEDCKAIFMSSLVEDNDGNLYTAIWPIKDADAGDIVTCGGLSCHGYRRLISLDDALTDAFDEDSLSQEDSAVISAFYDMLLENEYTVNSISSLLNLGPSFGHCFPVWELSSSKPPLGMREKALDILNSRRDQYQERLAILVKLFMLGVSVSYEEVCKVLEAEIMDSLVQWSILMVIPRTPILSSSTSELKSELYLQSLVQITPVVCPTTKFLSEGKAKLSSDLLLVTDFAQLSKFSGIDPVM
jgi:hypothetical protein